MTLMRLRITVVIGLLCAPVAAVLLFQNCSGGMAVAGAGIATSTTQLSSQTQVQASSQHSQKLLDIQNNIAAILAGAGTTSQSVAAAVQALQLLEGQLTSLDSSGFIPADQQLQTQLLQQLPPDLKQLATFKSLLDIKNSIAATMAQAGNTTDSLNAAVVALQKIQAQLQAVDVSSLTAVDKPLQAQLAQALPANVNQLQAQAQQVAAAAAAAALAVASCAVPSNLTVPGNSIPAGSNVGICAGAECTQYVCTNGQLVGNGLLCNIQVTCNYLQIDHAI